MASATNGGVAGLLWDIGGDVFRFPVWWYGKGAVGAIRYGIEVIQAYARKFGVVVWAKNIFTPMFGRYDWQSRIISVFMRIANVIVRGFALLVIAIVTAFLVIAFVALPIVATIMALYQGVLLFSV